MVRVLLELEADPIPRGQTVSVRPHFLYSENEDRTDITKLSKNQILQFKSCGYCTRA